MINVEEHVYRDDPQAGHADVRTCLRNVCYFFIGNGLIAAAVQHAPAGEGTPYGLLLMNPEHLKTKRESLSFDPGAGIAATMLRICSDGSGRPLDHQHLSVAWDHSQGIPCVRVSWQADLLEVSELLYCPERSSACIARDVYLRNRSLLPSDISVATGLVSWAVSRRVEIAAGEESSLHIIYEMSAPGLPIACRFEDQRPAIGESLRYWSSVAQVRFESAPMDHLFQTAAAQLPAVISRAGRVDAGIWQYNREWVRDQAMMIHAIILCGHHRLAKVMLERLLREFVSEEGSTVDSSEVREHSDAELDQNGVLLHVIREYVLWTGDLDIVVANWERIVLAAEFPLQPCFREPISGLMFNQRDYWERHATYGIEPGIELMYQVWVSIGLRAAAGLARQIGKLRESERWQSEAERLKHAILQHPTHSLVWAEGFCKRRGIDGAVQEYIVPRPDSGLPAGVGLARNILHPLNPDSASALPIVLGFVPPDSEIAQATLEQLEALWNQGWEMGGFGRYHMDSDPDSAGPWPFASLFIARASMECRQYDRVWRVIRWLASLPQYPCGAFFEMYGNRIAPPYAQNGIVPWNWAEVIMLAIKNMLGFEPEEDGIRVRPRLIPGLNSAQGTVPFRDRRIGFRFIRDDRIARPQFHVDAKAVAADGESVRIPFSGRDICIEGIIPAKSMA